jgi:hypothetical protein
VKDSTFFVFKYDSETVKYVSEGINPGVLCATACVDQSNICFFRENRGYSNHCLA